jgi:hypothetical protein
VQVDELLKNIHGNVPEKQSKGFHGLFRGNFDFINTLLQIFEVVWHA